MDVLIQILGWENMWCTSFCWDCFIFTSYPTLGFNKVIGSDTFHMCIVMMWFLTMNEFLKFKNIAGDKMSLVNTFENLAFIFLTLIFMLSLKCKSSFSRSKVPSKAMWLSESYVFTSSWWEWEWTKDSSITLENVHTMFLWKDLGDDIILCKYILHTCQSIFCLPREYVHTLGVDVLIVFFCVLSFIRHICKRGMQIWRNH